MNKELSFLFCLITLDVKSEQDIDKNIYLSVKD